MKGRRAGRPTHNPLPPHPILFLGARSKQERRHHPHHPPPWGRGPLGGEPAAEVLEGLLRLLAVPHQEAPAPPPAPPPWGGALGPGEGVGKVVGNGMAMLMGRGSPPVESLFSIRSIWTDAPHSAHR